MLIWPKALNPIRFDRCAPLALLVVSLALAVSCGGDSDGTPGSNGGSEKSRLGGNIEIDGSSTVFLITEAVAEEFHKVHPGVQVNVGSSGTGAGSKRFTVGDIDIGDASRPIKDAEAAAATENGVEYHEIRVAMDGLSVVVSPRNDFVECLTVEELRRIWEPGSTVDTWQDIRPGWPDRSIRLYGPGTDSGTFDYFTEEIVGEAQASRSDYTASEDDNVLVRGIVGDRNALGYFGYAYYEQSRDQINLVAIDSGAGCVAPSGETIENGTYAPLSRPLFIYVSKESLQRPEILAFFEFYMDNAAELAPEVGYVRLSQEDYTLSKSVVAQQR